MKRSGLAMPYFVWSVIFTIVPLFLVVFYAFTNAGGEWTLEYFVQFFDSAYLIVFWRSLVMAVTCTLICLLLGYPAALFLASRDMKNAGALLVLFVLPMWMNFLLRTYAWQSILGDSGLLNTLLTFIGLPKLDLLYTQSAVQLGMVYNYLPFMVLPIYSVLKKSDHRLIEAAEDLGATPFQVFTRVIFPLSLPGVASGVIMVFMPAVTTFVISRLLGGGQALLFGDLIERQFVTVGNWNFGSAISLVMMTVMLVSMGLLSISRKKEEARKT